MRGNISMRLGNEHVSSVTDQVTQQTLLKIIYLRTFYKGLALL